TLDLARTFKRAALQLILAEQTTFCQGFAMSPFAVVRPNFAAAGRRNTFLRRGYASIHTIKL
ncbi:MAG: hypothetical protein AAGH67_17585, partial [Cyanobacteria bacterium P01_H01_bin.162]